MVKKQGKKKHEMVEKRHEIAEEIEKGTKMEAEEHKKVTKGKKSVAKQIAKDHVVGEKMPKYYDALTLMEKKLKKPSKKRK
jgi:hypothetical protein